MLLILLPAAIAVMVSVVFSIIIYLWSEGKISYSLEERNALEDARQKDQENTVINSERESRARSEQSSKRTRKTKEYTERIKELQEELVCSFVRLEKMDILGEKEWHLTAIDFLINMLESHRANSISEALLLYDRTREREKERLERVSREYWERLEREKVVREQQEHNARMEQLERDRLWETEETRKDIEYFQRYGRPRRG